MNIFDTIDAAPLWLLATFAAGLWAGLSLVLYMLRGE